MGTYTIGEVAARTGFPATALRYDEAIGLVSPAGRTAAGYRLYDDATIARLAFIARAQQLGCTCCAFLRFAITVDERGVGLEIDAPAEATDVVAAMFAAAG